MHPTLATEVAAVRHAELLRAAELHRRARSVRTSSPTGRPMRAVLGTAVSGAGHQLRLRAAQLIALGSVRQSTPAPCC